MAFRGSYEWVRWWAALDSAVDDTELQQSLRLLPAKWSRAGLLYDLSVVEWAVFDLMKSGHRQQNRSHVYLWPVLLSSAVKQD
jgi:hypothetical protein